MGGTLRPTIKILVPIHTGLTTNALQKMAENSRYQFPYFDTKYWNLSARALRGLYFWLFFVGFNEHFHKQSFFNEPHCVWF